MDLDQLLYFKKVAELGHLTRAAEALYISQPSLSVAIRKLENEIGTALFERRGRSIILNKYGRIFLSHVNDICASMELALNEIDELKHKSELTLNIVSPSLFRLPNLMDRIYKELPDICINYTPESMESTLAGLLDHSIDFCISPLSFDDSRFSCTRLSQDEAVIVASCNHPLASSPHIPDFSLLAAYPFVSYPEGNMLRIYFEQCCAQAGFTPNVACIVKSHDDIVSALRGGNFIAFMPKLGANGGLPPELSVIEIGTPHFCWPRVLTVCNSFKLPAPARKVIELIKQYFADPPYPNIR